MNDTFLMCFAEPFRSLNCDIEQALERKQPLAAAIPAGPRGYQVTHRLPFEQFHDNEPVSGVFFHAVNGADVWMVEGRSSSGLPLETVLRFDILGQLFR